jgi:hypothetical protein
MEKSQLEISLERLGAVLMANGLDQETARHIMACPDVAKLAVEAVKKTVHGHGTDDTDHDGSENPTGYPCNYFF